MAGFDPSVSRAVEGLPVWVSSLWREEGVESLIDLALLYRDEPALQQHFQEVAQAEGRTDALEEDIRAAVGVWADARRRCPDAIATLAASIRATPGSSSGTGGRTRAASPGTHGQQYASKRIREAVPGPESSGSPPRFTGPAGEPDPQPGGSFSLSGPVVDEVYAVYLEAGEAGTKWLPFEPSEAALHKSLFVRSLRDASVKRLASALAVLRRMRSWLRDHCGSSCRSAHRCSALQMGAFLSDVATGGPTAASGAWALLEWWRATVGIPLPTDAPLVAAFRWVEAGHFSRSALELPLWAFLNLVRLAAAQAGAPSVLAQLALLLVMACIRWEHQGRSRVVAADGRYFYGHCAVGKSRKGGTRPGFSWRAPRSLAQGVDVLGPLLDLFNELYQHNGACHFLVPDVELEKGGLRQGCRWLTSRMPQRRFLELFRGLLVTVGMPVATAETTSYNTLRRGLPSIAECLEFGDSELQSIGNWADIPKGREKEKAKASHLTARIYAGDKDTSAAVNKHKAVIAVHLAAASWAKRGGVTGKAPTEWPPDSFTWTELRAMHPSVGRASKLACGGAPWATDAPFAELEGAEAWLSGCGGHRPRKSSMSSSVPARSPPAGDSSSSSGEEGEVDEGPLTDASGPAEAMDEASGAEEQLEEEPLEGGITLPPAFRLSLGRPWHLQASLLDEVPVPYCRDAPFLTKPYESGQDTAAFAPPFNWCKPCVARLPQQLGVLFRS